MKTQSGKPTPDLRHGKPEKSWYEINGIEELDSPALVIYLDRVMQNIKLVIDMIDDVSRLRPHVKTNKAKEAVELMIASGISKFKCATIAEAEMIALAGGKDVLLAYQPIGPKVQRLIQLIQKFPATTFSCLVDNMFALQSMAANAVEHHIEISVYLDLNLGMNRTGIDPGNTAKALCIEASELPGVKLKGIHGYDGHIRNSDLKLRKEECDAAFAAVESLKQELRTNGISDLSIVVGGSPTYPIHAKRKGVECSPGTFIYWDKGYQMALPEQQFQPAALVISRVISIPGKNKICLDLGHKSIASENDLSKRVFFQNAPDLKFIGQSEEHLVAEVDDGNSYKVGDILYGIPYHICPTIALYERAVVVDDNEITAEWKTIARDRKISI
jgi:D-threonine aldolase